MQAVLRGPAVEELACRQEEGDGEHQGRAELGAAGVGVEAFVVGVDLWRGEHWGLVDESGRGRGGIGEAMMGMGDGDGGWGMAAGCVLTHLVVDAPAHLRAERQAGGDEGVVQRRLARRHAVALLPQRLEGGDGQLVQAEQEAHQQCDRLDDGLRAEHDEGPLELALERR